MFRDSDPYLVVQLLDSVNQSGFRAERLRRNSFNVGGEILGELANDGENGIVGVLFGMNRQTFELVVTVIDYGRNLTRDLWKPFMKVRL